MLTMKRYFSLILSLALLAACSGEYSRKGSQVVIPCGESVVRLQVVAPGIVRVSSVPGGTFADRQSLAVVPQEGCEDFEVTAAMGKVRLATDSLVVEVYKGNGSVCFYRADGTPLLQNGQTAFEPVAVEGKQAWSVLTQFEAPEADSFYGLGQHQAGEFDHRGRREELYQYNTKVSVPFVVSTGGYGVLFDAYSLSRWGNPEPYRQLGEVLRLYDKDGVEGALTGTYIPARGESLVQREDSLFYENETAIRNLPAVPLNGARVVYEGFVEAPETADYPFIQYYAGFQQTTLDGEEMMSRRWRPAWNPNSYKFTAHLEKGRRTPVRIEWEPDGDVSYIGLRVAPPQSPDADDTVKVEFFAELTKLRLAALSLSLVHDDWQLGSSKTDALMGLLESISAVPGNQVVVFSQFTSYLAEVRALLDRKKRRYLYLDGQTELEERGDIVRQFQNGDCPLLLASLKAGGLGLNLTAANYVILLDPWWNPAIENQAMDRAHRIGQQRMVTVIRLIARHTIEEKILRLHETKQALADEMLDGTAYSGKLTMDDVLDMVSPLMVASLNLLDEIHA